MLVSKEVVIAQDKRKGKKCALIDIKISRGTHGWENIGINRTDDRKRKIKMANLTYKENQWCSLKRGDAVTGMREVNLDRE